MKIYLESVKYSGKTYLLRKLSKLFKDVLIVDELEDVGLDYLRDTFIKMLSCKYIDPLSKLYIELGIRNYLHNSLEEHSDKNIFIDRSVVSSFVYNDVDRDAYRWMCPIVNKLFPEEYVYLFLEEDFSDNYVTKIKSRVHNISDEEVSNIIKDQKNKYDLYLESLPRQIPGITYFYTKDYLTVHNVSPLVISLKPNFASNDSYVEYLSTLMKLYIYGGEDKLKEYLEIERQ